MDLRSTQLKDTYGNLLTIGESAGSPTTGTIENGDGQDITSLTIAGTADATLKIDSNRSDIILAEGDTTNNNSLIRQQSSLLRFDTIADDLTTITRRITLDHSSGDISFRDTSNNEAFYWDASEAFLGIGTVPATPLHVNATNANACIINVTGTSPNYIFDIRDDNVSQFRVDNSGNVGIGGSPSAKLHVNDTTYPTLRLSTATSYSNIYHDGTTGSIAYSADDGGAIASSSHQFYIDGASAMKLDGTGLGIGTTSPSEKLHVVGNTRLGSGTLHVSSDATFITSSAYTFRDGVLINNPNSLSAVATSNAVMSIGSSSGNSVATSLITTGAIAIGTTNPSRELDVVGVIQAQGSFISLVSSSSTNLATSNGGNVKLTNSSATDGNFNNIGGYNSNGLVTSQINFINVSQASRTGDISFNTHNGSSLSERMRIDSSGNVGIGVSPSVKLHIIDSSNPDNTSGSVIIEGRRDGVANTLTLRAKDASAPTSALPNGQGSVLRWQGFDGTDFENMGYILVSADGQAVADGDAPSFMAFGTSADGSSNPTERMRIDSSGSLLLAGLTDSTPNSEGAAGYLVTSADGSLFSILSAANNTATRGHIAFSNPNGIVGQITTNASATAYLTSSDYRLKENVVEMTGALDRVDQLKPSRFNFIADADTTVDGFLAHEVADVVPEAISGEKDATEEYEVTPAVLDDEGNVIEEAVMGTRPVYQGIDQSKLVPLLVGAIQELRAEIEQLKAQ